MTKRIEAWAVIPKGSDATDVTLRQTIAIEMAELKVHQPAKVVHLVESDPAAEAVVKTAVKAERLRLKWVDATGKEQDDAKYEWERAEDAHRAAVERYQKRKEKR